MKADLHLHSTASDGRLSPQELVRLAAQKGLEVMALTDHDSVEGIVPALEAARAFPPLRVIPGVEIGTDIPHGEVHILGYFVDYTSPQLQETLSRLRNARQERALKMIAKLRNLGIRLEWERVQELAGGGSVGRPHIAQAMLEKGYIPSLREAFIKYIGREGPAYAERMKLTPEEAVEVIKGAGGLAVLAHPLDMEPLEAIIASLKRVGLVGLEVYYNGYPPEAMSDMESLARRHGLILTGGSDFHGLDSATETPLGGVDIPEEAVKSLLALATRP